MTVPLDDPFWSESIEAAELRRDLQGLPDSGFAALATMRRAHTPSRAQAAFAAVPHLTSLLRPSEDRHHRSIQLVEVVSHLEVERIRRIQLPDPQIGPSYQRGLDAIRKAFTGVWWRNPDERDRLLVAAALFGGLTDVAHQLHWVFETPDCPRCATPFPVPGTPDLDRSRHADILQHIRNETLSVPDLVALAGHVHPEVAALLDAQHRDIPCASCGHRLPDLNLPDRYWTHREVRATVMSFDEGTDPVELWNVWTILGAERVREDPALTDQIRAMTAAHPAETRSRAFQILEEAQVPDLVTLARSRMTIETDPAVLKQIVQVISTHDDFDGLQVATDREGLLGIFATFTLASRANDLPDELALSTLLRIVELCGSDIEDPTAPAWEVVQRGVRTVPISSPHWVANQAVKALQTIPSRLLSRAAARWDALLDAPSPPLEGLVALGVQLGRPHFAEAVRALRRSGRPVNRPGIGPVLEAQGVLPKDG